MTGEGGQVEVGSGKARDQDGPVLIVDDDEKLLKSVERICRDGGYPVRTFCDPAAALRLFETEQFAVIIADYIMPTINGVDLLAQVQRRWPKTRRILMSGYADVESLGRAVNTAGICGFLPKPLDPGLLLTTVKAACDTATATGGEPAPTGELRRYDIETDRRKVEEAQTAQRADEQMQARNALGSAQVLVVDDDPAIQQMVQVVLAREGCMVATAENSAEALSQLRNTDFDVVVADAWMPGMPGMPGVELLRQVRENWPETQVVLITAHANYEAAVEGLRAGAFDLVAKPFHMERIRNIVSRAVERRYFQAAAELHEAARLIHGCQNRERLAELIVDAAMRAMGADDASLMLTAPDGSLYVSYSHGLPETMQAEARCAIGERVAGQVALSREPALLSGALQDDPRFEGVESYGRVCSSIVHPLVSGEQLLGVLNLNRVHDRRPFRQSDLQCAAVLASQIVLALENAQLLRTVVSSGQLAAIGQLAASVVHEINNPLAYALSNIALVRKGLETVAQGRNATGSWWETTGDKLIPEMQDEAGDVENGLARVRDIVRDMRALVPGKESPSRPFDLNDAIRSAIRIANPEIRNHRGELVTDLGDDVKVCGSPGQMSQVFLNLLVNAAHALHEGSSSKKEIVVSSCRSGERVIAKVSDTGAGIASQHLDRVFEPFFSTKPKDQGTGLGLSISRDIVHRHGGEIRVESSLGKGTVFEIVLPADAEREPHG